MFKWWIIGICLSLFASLFVLVTAFVCLVLLNPSFDALSYGYAAQSVLAPMAGCSVVWNIILSPYILKERLVQTDIIGANFILAGCVMVGVSGSHELPMHTRLEIFNLFQDNLFLLYVLGVALAIIVLIWLIISLPLHNSSRRFAFGALSGLVGGNLFFLKASVELIELGGDVWSYVETYLIIIAAVAAPAGGIYILNIGLKDYDALYMVTMYETFLILFGSISGIIFFDETHGMTDTWQRFMYPLGILTTIYGIYILSMKEEVPSGKLHSGSPLNISPNKEYTKPLVQVSP